MACSAYRLDRSLTIISTSVFGIVGLVLLAAGFVSLRRQLDFRKSSVSTSGTIVEPEGLRGRPVFEFEDRREHIYRVTGRVPARPSRYHHGDKVKVLYQPENPKGAQLDSFLESWLLPLIFGSFGTINIGIALRNVICALPNR